MAKFRKEGGKETPAISTASLPDIVFMLLFFFMVSTTMREVLVPITAPMLITSTWASCMVRISRYLMARR